MHSSALSFAISVGSTGAAQPLRSCWGYKSSRKRNQEARRNQKLGRLRRQLTHLKQTGPM